jgi:hypothetical protein
MKILSVSYLSYLNYILLITSLLSYFLPKESLPLFSAFGLPYHRGGGAFFRFPPPKGGRQRSCPFRIGAAPPWKEGQYSSLPALFRGTQRRSPHDQIKITSFSLIPPSFGDEGGGLVRPAPPSFGREASKEKKGGQVFFICQGGSAVLVPRREPGRGSFEKIKRGMLSLLPRRGPPWEEEIEKKEREQLPGTNSN